MLKIVVSKTFEKQFSKIIKKDKEYVVSSLENLSKEDKNLDIKKIQPKHAGFYRLRVGRYRIIFEYIGEKEICLLKIDSRDTIYFSL